MGEDNKKNDGKDSLDEPSTVIEPTKQEELQESLAEAETLTSTEGGEQPPAEPVRKGPPRWRRLVGSANLYFIIFALLFVLAAGGVFLAIRLNDDGGGKSKKTQSLTDEQLADLKGSTTLIGDSSQILDIQGSAVFQNQVLMRKDLDVAGSIKVGGSLSLPAITVGGTSSFGQIQVNDTLSVSGNTTLQGQLNVQRNLAVAGTASFNGAVSTNQLNVRSLQLTGDITISRHIATGGGTPSRTSGSALGSGGTASVNGTDTAGTVTINTGGGPPAGCFVTINFTNAYTSTPHVIISPSNSSSAGLDYYTNRSTGNFSICTASTPSGAVTYLFDYVVFN